MTKQCKACGTAFQPHPKVPNQTYCSSPECQRERRRRWLEEKRQFDADYQGNEPQKIEQWRNEHPDWIPKDWTLRSVASLGEIRSGSTPSRGKAHRYFHPEGTPWVKTLDLNEEVIRKTDECITVAALRKSSCSLLPVDSVLIAMYGGWEQIGRTAILGVPAATNQALSALTISDPDAVPEYVLRALQHGRPRWKRVAASTREDPNITKADVETFELAMPSTRDEQIAIVTRSCRMPGEEIQWSITFAVSVPGDLAR